jgi:hypothetical protein
MRIIDGNELDPSIHQSCDEGEVAGQAIKLGNDQLCLVPPTCR